jgi:hypothetical protein
MPEADTLTSYTLTSVQFGVLTRKGAANAHRSNDRGRRLPCQGEIGDVTRFCFAVPLSNHKRCTMTGLRGWMVALMVVFAALLGLGTLATVGVAAEKCPSKQQYFREFGCVKKSEVRKARNKCDAVDRPLMDCLCDTGLVKACNPPSKRAKSCKSNQTFVAKWGCVTDSEIKKAAKICAALPKSPLFTECLCGDGDQIGACGD